mmetsp:Transcript_35315/g.67517  ORF Transcript_35315/g.67517 Transcript_35315/m.67517 type:complete len:383 (-) Transcript_35315:548-1696(-)
MEDMETTQLFDCRSPGIYDFEPYTQSVIQNRRKAATIVFSVLLGPPSANVDSESEQLPRYLISATSNGTLSVFLLQDLLLPSSQAHKPLLKVQAHKGAAYATCFLLKNGEAMLYSGGDDGMILGWRWADLEQAAVGAQQGGAPEPCVHVECERTPGPYGSLGPVPEVNALAATSTGELLSGGGDGTVHVWEGASGKRVCSLRGHTATVHCVISRSSQQQAISGSEDGTVRVWDLKQQACVLVLDVWMARPSVPTKGGSNKRSPWVGCVALDEHENWLACGCGGQSITVWNLVAQVATARIKTSSPPQALVIAGDQIIAAGAESRIHQWTLSGELTQSINCKPASVFTLLVHPCGLTVVGGTGNGVVHVISQLGSTIAEVHCE